MLARHRSHGMGLERNRPYTDGVITGFGTIDSAGSACSARTSPSSVVRSARSSPRRSTR